MTTQTDDHKKTNTLYQCLLGGAVGDALGLPFEGLSATRTTKLFKNTTAYNLVPWIQGGMVSDDTEHAVMTVQAYLASNGDVTHFRKSLRMYLRLWLLGLPAGIGLATGRALFKLWLFLPNSGVFSAGNGGAMRSAVLGVMINDLDELRDFVTISTQITHTDPKAVEGAMVVALSAWFCKKMPNNMDDAKWSQTLLQLLLVNTRDDELKGYLQTVYEASQTEQNLNDVMYEIMQHKSLKKGISGYMYHTIPAVMFAYFRYPHQPIKGLQCLIHAGGDVDTTCAIASGIWGVNYGEEMFNGIEGKWLEPKITPDFLQTLAHQVYVIQQENVSETKPVRFGGIITLIRNLVFLVIVLLHGFRRLLPPY